MKLLPTSLPGVALIELQAFVDQRGMFMEAYRRASYREAGIDVEFVQDNFSSSGRGTLRGLHYQLHQPQGKLIYVTRGEVFDVAVDIRIGSPTYAQWFGALLSVENHRQMWIPPGFAHGFLVTSDVADLVYKMTAEYAPRDEHAIRWDDSELAIEWPLTEPPVLSKRDAEAPGFQNAALPSFIS